MKKYYISSVTGDNAISKYSNNFYELVLRNRGYEFMDSSQSFTDILSAVSSRDHAHIEIGIRQKKEIELLFRMLRAKYKFVSVTLHDPPLVKFPFFEFKNPILNGLSKIVDRYTNNFGADYNYVRQIKSIYVLSDKDVELTKRKYRAENVFHLSYLINQYEIERDKDNRGAVPEGAHRGHYMEHHYAGAAKEHFKD